MFHTYEHFVRPVQARAQPLTRMVLPLQREHQKPFRVIHYPPYMGWRELVGVFDSIQNQLMFRTFEHFVLPVEARAQLLTRMVLPLQREHQQPFRVIHYHLYMGWRELGWVFDSIRDRLTFRTFEHFLLPVGARPQLLTRMVLQL